MDDPVGDDVQAEANALADFPALYHRYLRPVYRYLYFRTGDRQEAEDLTSQVFLAALEGLPSYRPRTSFAAWLFAIARHKAADHYRRQRGQLPLEMVAGSLVSKDDPLQEVITSQGLSRLAEAVAALREDDQELLRLRFAGELSFDEIASLTQRSPGAVKMKFYRLLRWLEVQMEKF